jgi:hypothetical protein
VKESVPWNPIPFFARMQGKSLQHSTIQCSFICEGKALPFHPMATELHPAALIHRRHFIMTRERQAYGFFFEISNMSSVR